MIQALEKKSGKTVRIAIAHHKDDIAETMMMNLFRGSGLEGLVNPKPVAGRIIRPLLCLKKSELVDYLDTLGVRYAIDQTNLTTDGTRNTWRNDFLPKIGEYYNEDPSVPLTRAYKLLSDDLDYISAEAGKAYASSRDKLSGQPVISASKLKEMHPAIRSRVIRALWLETFGDLVDFEEIHLKDCFSLIGQEPSGQMLLDMPFGRKAFRHGDIFAFVTEDKISGLSAGIAQKMGFLTSEEPLNVDIDLENYKKDSDLVVKIPNSALKIRVSRFENKGDLEYNNFSWFCPIEYAQDGKLALLNSSADPKSRVFGKAGASGSKKVTRLFTDLKVPESARDCILYVARNDGDRILWIPGVGHAAGFTSPLSRERYGQAEGKKTAGILKITLERRQDGN